MAPASIALIIHFTIRVTTMFFTIPIGTTPIGTTPIVAGTRGDHILA